MHRYSITTFSVSSILTISLASILACGSSSSDPETPEPAFAEKLSNFSNTEQGLFFAVEVDTNRYELMLVNPTTGALTQISDELSINRGLQPYKISPNGSLVAYRADRDFDGIDELYVNSIAGNSEQLLTDELPQATPASFTQGGSQLVQRTNWEWSVNSEKIIFHSDIDNDDIFEIQIIDADGSDLTLLSADLSTQCFDSCWKLSANGEQLAFISEVVGAADEVSQNLYMVNLDGSGLTQVNQDLSDNSRISQWQWTDDSSAIVYISQNIGSPAQLYSASNDGITRTIYSQAGQETGVSKFALNSTQEQIVYSEDSNLAGTDTLFIIDRENLEKTELIDRFNVTNPTIINWAWSPMDQRIAYMADQETQGVFELFTVQPDGFFHRKINDNYLASGQLQENWQWANSGEHLLYSADIETSTAFDELYINANDGSNNVKANPNLQEGSQLIFNDYAWGLNDSRVIYAVENSNQQISALYSVETAGTNNTRLNEALANGDYLLSNYQFSSDSQSILFRQFRNSDQTIILNLSTLDGLSSQEISSIGEVDYYAWSNDNSRIIYQVKLSEDSSEQLFSKLPDGTSAVRLY